MTTPSQTQYDYIVVGSGAGGGTLAARLAEEGHRVLLLEAGGDPRELRGGDPLDGDPARLPDDYDVPAFHGLASENEALAWNFYVKHHDEEAANRRDPKFVRRGGPDEDGILYPRAAALGGCTAHNAMIWVYPHDADWDAIATATGDGTWSAASMRRLFQKIENCRHRPVHRWLGLLGLQATGHGWRGWLPVEHAVPWEALTDKRLRRVVIQAGLAAMRATPRLGDRLRWFFTGWFDPNDRRLVRDNAIGIRYVPLTTKQHRRVGTRERLLEVRDRFPGFLTIQLGTLVTRVLLDDQRRAYGVEFRRGARLYRAHVAPSSEAGELGEAHAAREVILSGGAFNTPQLLMLSGIGPPEVLRKYGITERVALPGVGRNLQDRYEVGVVSRMDFPEWQIFRGATFRRGDAAYRRWEDGGRGLYATNGAVLTMFTRSTVADALPDLFVMAMVARFEGYAPNYSASLGTDRNFLTWVVLKAHTKNTAGEVTLKSRDPRDPPHINFRQWVDGGAHDLRAVADGVRFVRRLNDRLRAYGNVVTEVVPGPAIATDDAIEDHVRHNAWGHHACGTCAIGPQDRGGVVDSRFRVHGTAGLRVVDASVFPTIPGFFIASAVYMVGEKAADVILSDAGGDRGRATPSGPREIDFPRQVAPRCAAAGSGVPLTLRLEGALMAVDVPSLFTRTKEQLDDLFRAAEAGPIPNGAAKGTALVATGTAFSDDLAHVINLFAWQGKTFDAAGGVLRNRITALGLNAIVAEVYLGKSLLDDKPCVVLDYSKTSLVAKWIRDEIRLVAPHLYLGRVYWDNKPTLHFALEVD